MMLEIKEQEVKLGVTLTQVDLNTELVKKSVDKSIAVDHDLVSGRTCAKQAASTGHERG